MVDEHPLLVSGSVTICGKDLTFGTKLKLTTS